MNIVFWIDPIDSLDKETDTSMAFMREAKRRGHDIFYLPTNGVSIDSGKLLLDVVALSVEETTGEVKYCLDKSFILTEKNVDILMIRKNPPVDESYLCQTWLLDSLQSNIFMSNHPRAIRSFNEKIWISRWPDLTPPTLLTSSFQQYEQFLKKHRSIVMKPYSGVGGSGVCIVKEGGDNTSVLFELLSHSGEKTVLLQKYLEKAVQGDKRILLLDGEVLGAVLRVPVLGDHRSNICLGGRAQPADITDQERSMIQVLKPTFQKEGLHLVGLDFIDNQIIEVNVTSPSCLVEMNQLYSIALEKKVIDFLEKKVSKNNISK